MAWMISILLGLGLSAAVGFRLFVPFFCAGLAAYNHWITLPEGIAWMGTLPALIAFGTATVIEIGGYYVPWIDHLLDVVATPAATIAGALMMGGFVTEIDPLLKWTLAIIAGGGTAGLISAGTAAVRVASTAVTGGAGNPLVATGELGSAALVSFLAIFIPVVAAILVVVLVILALRFIRKAVARRKSSSHMRQTEQ